MNKLQDDEKALLGSIEGLGAFRIVLPLIRALARHIAGLEKQPDPRDHLPDLRADCALERARYKALEGHKR